MIVVLSNSRGVKRKQGKSSSKKKRRACPTATKHEDYVYSSRQGRQTKKLNYAQMVEKGLDSNSDTG